MADVPIENSKGQTIKVTNENFGPVAVHFLQLIYQRLGYIIKLIEANKTVK